MTLPEALPAFVAALGASFHCAGMCGGFAIASGAAARGRKLLLSQLLFLSGKGTSYVFLGVLAAAGGGRLRALHPVLGDALAVLAGLFIAGVGLRSLGLRRLPRPRVVRVSFVGPRDLWTSMTSAVLSLPSRFRPLHVGVLSGFLPCPIVYAFLARAAAGGSPLEAALLLTALAFGTAPVLLAIGMTGSLLSPVLRGRMALLGGAFLVAFGIYTALRGLLGTPCCPGSLT